MTHGDICNATLSRFPDVIEAAAPSRFSRDALTAGQTGSGVAPGFTNPWARVHTTRQPLHETSGQCGGGAVFMELLISLEL